MKLNQIKKVELNLVITKFLFKPNKTPNDPTYSSANLDLQEQRENSDFSKIHQKIWTFPTQYSIRNYKIKTAKLEAIKAKL
jgi:hypothetical protein